MKKILFVLWSILSTYSFADTDAEISHGTCKTHAAMAEATQLLRQSGMQASDVTEKLLEVSKMGFMSLNQQIDEKFDKNKAGELKNIKDNYKKVMDDQALILVQQAFEIPIQPNKELKNKVIEKFANDNYLWCLSTLRQIKHMGK